MPLYPVSNLGMNMPVYTAPPFGLYTTYFVAGAPSATTGFLATMAGAGTRYPHRAVLFPAVALYSVLPRFMLSQSASYVEFYQQRLATDADYFPVTPDPVTGYRVTANVATNILSSLPWSSCGCGTRVFVDTTPDTDPFATPVSIGDAVAEAIRVVANGATESVIYYNSALPNATPTYTPLFTVTEVTLTP